MIVATASVMVRSIPVAIVLGLVFGGFRAPAQNVRVLAADGTPLSDVRVLFVCEEGRMALMDARAWLISKGKEVYPVEELPGDGAGVVAFTDEHGEAALHTVGGLSWSACVVQGDRGAEAELENDDDDAKERKVVEMRLRPLQRVLVVDCDGKPLPGAQISRDSSGRVFETDAEGRAVLPTMVAFRWGNSKPGVRWVAPASEVATPWIDGETVLKLPEVGRLVVVDGEHQSDQRPAKLKAGAVVRRMHGGTVTFAYVPAAKPIDLELAAGFDAEWRESVVVGAGETRVVTLRTPPAPAVLRGMVASRIVPPGRLTIVAFFIDREPGEPATEGTVEADGSFVLRLPSRRPAGCRDVGFIVKPADELVPLRSPIAPIRKRLAEPDPDGGFSVGILQMEVIQPWLAGLLTDMRGRPLRNVEIELDYVYGCRGCGCFGGPNWGEDPRPETDPTRPELELWPRIIRTDSEGRFSVTGSKDPDRNFEFQLRDGRHVFPGAITPPALTLHLVADYENAVEVEIDGNSARVADRAAILEFEARPASGGGLVPNQLDVVRDSIRIEPEPEAEPPSWSAVLKLAPGRWLVSMRVDEDSTVVADGLIEVLPARVVEPSGDVDSLPSRPRFRLELRNPVQPAVPPPVLRNAKVIAVGEDGLVCPNFSVLMRADDRADWESCDGELGAAVLAFAETEVEVLVFAPGFAPALTRIGEGTSTVTLKSVPKTALHVRVAPFPTGVQKNATWWVRVRFVKPSSQASPAEAALPRDLDRGNWLRVVGGSAIDTTLRDPGVYEVALMGGPLWKTLTYAAREVEMSPGHPVNVELTVDPESEGMRALTTGIGW